MRVFLTGATGLIGRALAASLVQDGHEVVALSRKVNQVTVPSSARARSSASRSRASIGWPAAITPSPMTA